MIKCARCHEDAEAGTECPSCGHDPLLEGRWGFSEMLGHGAAGHTWLATDEETGDVTAIKELSFRRITELKQLELFEREADTLRTLDHPGIPTYSQHFAVEDDRHVSFYLVQEFVDGKALSVDDGTDEKEVVDFLKQMADILAYLQDRRPPVIHRDIKPSNVMRRQDGSYVLIDFGSTRIAAGATMGGSTVAGTLGYMAPEQLHGDASPASDIYGLGATAIAMLAGEDASGVLDIRYPGEWREEVTVSEALGGLLGRMVDVDETKRFSDAEELREALDDLGHERPRKRTPERTPEPSSISNRELLGVRARLDREDPDEETWRDVLVGIGRAPLENDSLGWLYLMGISTYILSVVLFGIYAAIPEGVRPPIPDASVWYPIGIALTVLLMYASMVVVGRRLDDQDVAMKSVLDVLRYRRLRQFWRNWYRGTLVSRLVAVGPVIFVLLALLKIWPVLAPVALAICGLVLADQLVSLVRRRSGWRNVLGAEFDEVWPRGSELRKTFRDIVDRLWGHAYDTSNTRVRNAYEALLELRDAELTGRQRDHLDLVLLAVRARTGDGEDLARSMARIEEIEPSGVTLDALLAAADEADDEEVAVELAARYVTQKQTFTD